MVFLNMKIGLYEGYGVEPKFQNVPKHLVFVSISVPKWDKKFFICIKDFRFLEWSTFVTKLAKPPKVQKISWIGGLNLFQMLSIDVSSGFGSYFDGLMCLKTPKNILSVPTARRRIGHWWFI